MAVGSHCLYEGTATPTLSSGTFADFNPTWTEVRDADGVYSIVSGNIRVADAGRYLVVYGLRATHPTDGNRLSVKCRLRINTTVIEGSYSTGFRRNPTNQHAYMNGGCIVDLAANDDIDVQYRVTGITTATSSPANETYIQLVRLTEDADTDYAHYSDGADVASYNTATYVSVPWNTIEEETDTLVIQRNGSGPGINLKGAIGDRFLVLVAVPIDAASGTRTQRYIHATLAGTEIEGCFGFSTLRNTTTPFGCPHMGFIVEKQSGSDEELLIQMRAGTTTAPVEQEANSAGARVINESGLFIMKLLSTTEVVGTHDATAGETMEGTALPAIFNIFRNEDFRDSASYTLTDLNTITMLKTAGYAVFGNMQAVRGTDVNSRSTYRGSWEVNATPVREGAHGNYTRGNSIHSGGVNLMGILNLTADDTVQLEMTDQGDDGGNNLDTQVDRVGFFAINLGTLEPAAGGAGKRSPFIARNLRY